MSEHARRHPQPAPDGDDDRALRRHVEVLRLRRDERAGRAGAGLHRRARRSTACTRSHRPSGAAVNVSLISHCETCCIGVVDRHHGRARRRTCSSTACAKASTRCSRSGEELRRTPAANPPEIRPCYRDRRSRPTSPSRPSSLPCDGRFGSGPSKVRDDSVAALAAGRARTTSAPATGATACDRSSAASATGIAELFALPDGYEVLLGNGGSTLFWDAAVVRADRDAQLDHLVIGEFSSKFAAIAEGRAAPRRPRGPRDRNPATRPVLARRGRGRRLRLSAQRDLHRRRRPAAPAGRSDALVVVDATSAARAACASSRRQFDVYYFAPQKCFASDGGLWLACCSPARDRTHRTHPRERALDAADARSRHRARQLAPRPDVQHARARDALPRREPDRVDARARRPRVRGRPCDTSAATIYDWADVAPVGDARSSRTRPTAAT